MSVVVGGNELLEKFFNEFNLNGADDVTKLTACELLYLVRKQYFYPGADDMCMEEIRQSCYPDGMIQSNMLVFRLLNLANTWSNDLIDVFSESMKTQGIDSRLIVDFDDIGNKNKGYNAIHAFLHEQGYRSLVV